MPCRPSKGLQEIHDRADLLVGQNPVSSERRHHGQRIALGFVVENGDEILALGVFTLDVNQLGPDCARTVSASANALIAKASANAGNLTDVVFKASITGVSVISILVASCPAGRWCAASGSCLPLSRRS